MKQNCTHNVLKQIVNLPQMTLLKLTGQKVKEFLQGQLTCDINNVNATSMQPGFLCDLKGRILVNIDVLMINNHYHLLLATDLLPILEKDLRIIKQLSRVQWEAVSSVNIFSFCVDAITENIKENKIDLPTELFQCKHTASTFCYAATSKLFIYLDWSANSNLLTATTSEPSAWGTLCLLSNVRNIHPETSGLFLPHELELAHSPWVSFDKGCYKGQEILARMHFLGKSKTIYRTILLPKNNSSYKPGDKLIIQQTEIGLVVECQPYDEKNVIVSASIKQQYENFCN